jgi:hypothetical protein
MVFLSLLATLVMGGAGAILAGESGDLQIVPLAYAQGPPPEQPSEQPAQSGEPVPPQGEQPPSGEVSERSVSGSPAVQAEASKIISQRFRLPAHQLLILSEGKVDQLSRVKVLHVPTGRIEVVNLDPTNREVPPAQVEQLLAIKRGRDFRGKSEVELADKVGRGGPAGTTTLGIWAKNPGAPPRIDRIALERGQAGPQIKAYKDFHKNSTKGLREFVESRGGKVEFQAEFAPLLIVTVPNSLAPILEQRGEVDGLYLGREYKEELNASVPAIDANTVWTRGNTGQGVQIAVVEADAIYFGHTNLADGTTCNPTSGTGSSPVGGHATGVAGIIASTHATNRGVAFGAPALLSGNATGYSDAAIIKCTEWAINRGARVINYSFGVDSTSSMVGLDRYVDYVVRHHAVTMVKSAGNINFTCFGPGFFISSPGKGWNIITVGNYDDRGTASNSDDVMSAGSCYQDPTSPYGDREKPEVAAPGTSIMTTYCTTGPTCFASGTGTSFSAPHVAGCSALLMQRNSALKYWPESVKAVLMASAVVNLEGSSRLSEKDGAGGIECDSADDVVRGTAGSEAHGSFGKADFPRTFTFSAKAGQTVRVVIAWDSTTDALPTPTSAPTTDVLKADFDLTVLSPTAVVVGTSASWDNSYETVEFTAPVTGTYSAKVSARRFDGSSEFLGFAHWKGTRER